MARGEGDGVDAAHRHAGEDETPGADNRNEVVFAALTLVGLAGAGVTPKGSWNDYEIRVVGQHYSVFRNGVLINDFVNTPGAVFNPPRADDPGTAGRQRASGYIGLQNHGAADVIAVRGVQGDGIRR